MKDGVSGWELMDSIFGRPATKEKCMFCGVERRMVLRKPLRTWAPEPMCARTGY